MFVIDRNKPSVNGQGYLEFLNDSATNCGATRAKHEYCIETQRMSKLYTYLSLTSNSQVIEQTFSDTCTLCLHLELSQPCVSSCLDKVMAGWVFYISLSLLAFTALLIDQLEQGPSLTLFSALSISL